VQKQAGRARGQVFTGLVKAPTHTASSALGSLPLSTVERTAITAKPVTDQQTRPGLAGPSSSRAARHVDMIYLSHSQWSDVAR